MYKRRLTGSRTCSEGGSRSRATGRLHFVRHHFLPPPTTPKIIPHNNLTISRQPQKRRSACPHPAKPSYKQENHAVSERYRHSHPPIRLHTSPKAKHATVATHVEHVPGTSRRRRISAPPRENVFGRHAPRAARALRAPSLLRCIPSTRPCTQFTRHRSEAKSHNHPSMHPQKNSAVSPNFPIQLRQSNIVSRKEHTVHKALVSFAVFVAENHPVSSPYLPGIM